MKSKCFNIKNYSANILLWDFVLFYSMGLGALSFEID